MGVSWWTGRNADNEDFFVAGRQSPWLLVAIGMIGASLSGVTFISIPGVVGAGKGNMNFSYMQMVLGYLAGYLVIGTVLLPLYYRLKLTSIYGYLGQRFGDISYKTGAGYFLLSRVIGASFRLYLVAIVLDQFVLGVAPFNFPFWVTVSATILLIWVYTFKGGIKTIVWTDALQTICMLAAVILTISAIGTSMEKSIGDLFEIVKNSEYSKVFYFEGGWSDPNNFFKQFISGALIAVVMTGLDQDMMQKNLSCRSLGDAQKNMFTFSIILVFANLLFLTLGALLYLYAANIGLEIPADSALTALTTSFCVDFLGFEKSDKPEEEKKKTRFWVHVGFSVLLLFVILIFNALNDDAVINNVFKWAGLTYGPLLGLFSFGMLTNRRFKKEILVLVVCLIAPVLSYILDANNLFINFKLGHMIILLNGILTFVGLFLISEERQIEPENIYE